jgi:hypothetical protein
MSFFFSKSKIPSQTTGMTHNDFTKSISKNFYSLAPESRGADIISSINLFTNSLPPLNSVFGLHQPELISECVEKVQNENCFFELPNDDRFGCKIGTTCLGAGIQQITAFNQPRMMHMHPVMAAVGANQNAYISTS